MSEWRWRRWVRRQARRIALMGAEAQVLALGARGAGIKADAAALRAKVLLVTTEVQVVTRRLDQWVQGRPGKRRR